MKKKFFLILSILFMIFAFNAEYIQAEDITTSYKYQTLGDFSFAFPAEVTLSESTNQVTSSNIFSYVDDEFSTIKGTYADIYHFITAAYPDMSEEQLLNKYPHDSIWTYCGLLDETWANYDYVLNYLTDTVNSGSVVYNCEMTEITLDSIPFYKFVFKVDGDMENPPGGIIYLTLYKSYQYTIQFCNFLGSDKSIEYADIFESTLSVNGADSYDFTVYETDVFNTTADDIKVSLIVWALVCLIIFIPSFIINTKGFNK